MSKSLADLRANRPTARPERSLTVCLAPDLVAEVQALTAELNALDPQSAENDEQGAPRRAVPSRPPRAAEIRARLADLLAEIAENEGEIRLRATKSDGEWRRWCNEHPPRSENEPGFDRDERVAAGICNADALLDDLGTYVVAWNGDDLSGSDWVDVFETSISGPDKVEMALGVVAMYEVRLDFPRWRTGLSANLRKWSASDSPATSASPTSDSTDGNPEPSSEATTATASQ